MYLGGLQEMEQRYSDVEDLDPHVGELLDELELLHPIVDLKDFFRFSGAGVRMKRNVFFVLVCLS